MKIFSDLTEHYSESLMNTQSFRMAEITERTAHPQICRQCVLSLAQLNYFENGGGAFKS